MKVLMINGSPRANGNTYIALNEMEKIFHEEGIETEIMQIGSKDIRGCIACNSCMKNKKCVFDDLVNETAPKFEEC
ncbi:MAG: flavodoxin family protein, partial [Oscillospiraceae bacterium]|nr:flavodoxin family protein [Oscillospiraceae bacterium]